MLTGVGEMDTNHDRNMTFIMTIIIFTIVIIMIININIVYDLVFRATCQGSAF